MAATFELDVATPERSLVKVRAEEAQIPGKDGYMGILPDHAALLSELGFGTLTFRTGGKTETLAILGGYVQIQNNVVRVLADAGEPAHEIDVTRAQEALRRAKQAMINPSIGIDIAQALSAVMRAEARIRAAEEAAKKS
ncbi:MAG: ATP synthase F1 subunit epsilon [Bryobacteraceae bacterium]